MRNFTSLVGVIFGVTILASGCKSRTFNDKAETQVILGKDDRILINKNKSNIPKEYAALADAVGLMKVQDKTKPNGVSERLCTGFHAGGGIVLTAGHCIVGERIPNPAPILIDRTPTNPRFFDFNDIQEGKLHRSQVIKAIYAQNTPYGDFAIIEINNPPKASLRVNRGARPPVGSKISLISGGENKTLMWSNFCLVRPEAPYGDRYYGPWPQIWDFDYTCDTKIRASGSPLFLDQDKSVVGVHYNGGIAYAEYTGPVEPGVTEEDLSAGINQAMFMDVVLQYLPKKYESRLSK